MHRISTSLTKIFPFRVFPISNFKKTLGRKTSEEDSSKINSRVVWSFEDHYDASGDLLNIKKKIYNNNNKLQK